MERKPEVVAENTPIDLSSQRAAIRKQLSAASGSTEALCRAADDVVSFLESSEILSVEQMQHCSSAVKKLARMSLAGAALAADMVCSTREFVANVAYGWDKADALCTECVEASGR